MRATLHRLQLAARLARREARRHPGRHLLVVLLIFVPTLAAFATFSAISSGQASQQLSVEFTTGGADFTATEPSPDQPDLPRPLTPDDEARLPAGSHVEHRWTSVDWLVGARQRADGLGPVLIGSEVLEVPPSSRLAGAIVLRQGRRPQGAGEVLLSESLARSGGWNLGDRVTSARTGHRLRVVGIGVRGAQIDERAMVVAPERAGGWGAPLPTIGSANVGGSGWMTSELQRTVYVWLPDGATKQVGLPTLGLRRTRSAPIDARTSPLLTLTSAAAAALVAVVASAAFAIASRRQLRTVGLLSAAGADPGVIRAALVLQGAIPGLIAGLLALATGAVVAAILRAQHVAERLTHVSGAPIVLSRWGAFVAVAVGTGAGALAAWHPSRVAARVPVLSALAGRRPVGPVDPKVPLLGVGLWLGGAVALIVGMRAGMRHGAGETVQPFVIVLGALALALGGVGLAPAAVALLGRIAARTTGMFRMALRGLARSRSQSAASVAAVAMALALPVGLLTVRAGQAKDRRANEIILVNRVIPPTTDVAEVRVDRARTVVRLAGALRSPSAAEVTDEVLGILGADATVVRTLPIVDQTGAWQRVSIIDESDAGRMLAPWAADAIRAGSAVSIGTEAARSGQVTLKVAKDQATFPIVAPPDGAIGVIQWTAADYVVGKQAMGLVGRERPVDAITVVRRLGATSTEDAQLRRLARRLDPPRPSVDAPTLAEVEQAMGRSPGASPTDPGGSDGAGVTIGWAGARPDGLVSVASPRSMPALTHDDKVLLSLAGGSGLVAVLILTVTLSLRSVDGASDRAALLAAGATPGQVTRQRAVEGAVLALLGAALAVPLGWLTMMAVRFGQVRHSSEGNPILARLVLPGWQVLPILVAPAIFVALVWWLAPTVRAALRRQPTDALVPRW